MVLDLSIRLKRLRVDKHLRQEQVAEIIGVTKSAISYYENDIRQPSYDILLRFASLYRVSTDYLLGRTDIHSLDVSGLTEDEVSIVTELVASMVAKNDKLLRCRCNDEKQNGKAKNTYRGDNSRCYRDCPFGFAEMLRPFARRQSERDRSKQ